VAVAEASGLIALLGERILTKACREAGPWIHAVPGFQLSLNLSPRQLDPDAFASRVIGILTDARLPGGGLLLEVPETAVLLEDVCRRENLRVLGRAGIGVVIDDFGSA
jgi:EAL domain-containing protein (putative c-di-GMP-specific phosphodiesterase class I)